VLPRETIWRQALFSSTHEARLGGSEKARLVGLRRNLPEKTLGRGGSSSASKQPMEGHSAGSAGVESCGCVDAAEILAYHKLTCQLSV